MRPLSIVHLATYLQGGAGRAITDVAVQQRRAGHTVLVVTSASAASDHDNAPQYVERLRAEGIPIVVEDSLFTRDQADNDRVLQRVIAERAPDTVDVVHAHAATPARIARRYAAAATRKVVVVQTQHGWGASKTPEQSAHDMVIPHEVDAVIVCSEVNARLIGGWGMRRDHIITIPCGLPAQPPASVPDEARRALAPLRGAGRRLIGCVGSPTATENPLIVVEALALTADRGLTAAFIGEGGEALRARAAELGLQDRVHVLGNRPGAERWIPLFDLLVVPSLTEGHELVVLEAFRSGVPVAASDIPPLRELVSHGETGWLFDPADAASAKAAIEQALHAMTAERARVAQSARQLFLEQYTLEDAIARHDALYRRLLETANPPVQSA